MIEVPQESVKQHRPEPFDPAHRPFPFNAAQANSFSRDDLEADARSTLICLAMTTQIAPYVYMPADVAGMRQLSS